MAVEQYDFSGWATRSGLKCSDGRTICSGAFAHQSGATVPLVWGHERNNMSNIIGHATLEDRPEGVYAYCSLNNTEDAKTARELVEHKDITQMSIYANKLKQKNGEVLHGAIREVSLVIAGANPGAVIDVPYIKHDDGSTEYLDEAVIYTPDEYNLELYHYDDSNKKKDDASDGEGGKKMKKNEGDIDVQAVIDSLDEDQKIVIGMMLAEAEGKNQDDVDDDDDTKDHKKKGKDDDMKHNVFDNDSNTGEYLSHAEQLELEHGIISDAKRYGSLKEMVDSYIEEGVLEHAVQNADGSPQTYGMANVNYLFPDAKAVNNVPGFIQRKNEWVGKVMSGVHNVPFSRIKSLHADITMDEARARGYLKGKEKVEEVFTLLKRSTDPQTIYKKQKLDKDDISDITDFDVVAWLKGEMRMMLEEEAARAMLIGDGRSTAADDHIKHDHIRPIAFDDDLYTIKVDVTTKPDATSSAKAKAFIASVIRSRKDYRGAGEPTLFTTEDMLADLLLIEDGIGHLLYSNVAALATQLRVKEIVTVPVMEGLKDKDNNPVLAVLVNLADYYVGADKGGKTDLFEDFDIDFNQMKYLIETRMSGALTTPKSAITYRSKTA